MTRVFRLGERFSPDTLHVPELARQERTVRELIADAANIHGGARKAMYRAVRRYGGRPPKGTALVRTRLAARLGVGTHHRRDSPLFRLECYLRFRADTVPAKDAWVWATSQAKRADLDWDWDGDKEVATLERDGLTLKVTVEVGDYQDCLDGVATLSKQPGEPGVTYDRAEGDGDGWDRRDLRYIILDWDPAENYPYYRKQGMSKAVAWAKVHEVFRDQVAFVEKVIRGDVRDYYVEVVATYQGKAVGQASCGGVDAEGTDDDHLREVVDDLIDEALSDAEDAVAEIKARQATKARRRLAVALDNFVPLEQGV